MEDLKGRHLLSLQQYNKKELMQILETAAALQAIMARGVPFKPLQGKTLGMIFNKNSTRTRVSFEVAIYQLGGHGLHLGGQELQLARGESIADTARVLSRYLDAIMIRTYSHAEVEELAANATVPVINGLTDRFHPCQALADFYTLYKKKGRLAGLKLAFVGDGNNNVTHSLLLGAAKLGVDIHVAAPAGYAPEAEVLALARQEAKLSGSSVLLTTDPVEAVAGADAVYTDVWTSMGKEDEAQERCRILAPYQVNSSLMAAAKPDALFLHCLPANRGEEVTDEVMDGPNSAVFDQAENRLHVQKAVLALLVRGGELVEEMANLLGDRKQPRVAG
ncbi:MAG: ornithine carbamoyltransferase [bacterium]|jgi:ornithine carbamoyltransferase|nr:ornithine carbamoyltransferase [Bacillota bacterium]HHW54418.1 ornithine carbamoyltransferase [Bacillota bacterium]